MEKTFRKVIVDIKEGEVWENELLEVRIINNYIDIKNKTGWMKGEYISIKSDLILSLKRKEYMFEEAFKAYEEGKEIENQHYKYKKINGIDSFKLVRSRENKWRECEDGFEFHLDEIRGKWYIND